MNYQRKTKLTTNISHFAFCLYKTGAPKRCQVKKGILFESSRGHISLLGLQILPCKCIDIILRLYLVHVISILRYRTCSTCSSHFSTHLRKQRVPRQNTEKHQALVKIPNSQIPKAEAVHLPAPILQLVNHLVQVRGVPTWRLDL